jgi:hypothetical protein
MNISVLCLTALLLLRVLIVPLLYLDYEIRKDFIAKNLCINRNKPTLHCDGKCYLAKRIAAAEQQEQEASQHAFMRFLLEIEYISPVSGQKTVFDWVVEAFKPLLPPYSFSLTTPSVPSIFHPPISLV